MIRHAVTAALFACAVPVAATVADSTPAGFTVAKTVTIKAAPELVWDTLREPSRWWAKDHTWSGNAANLYLDDHATGCFCEKLPGRGSVEHARLIFVDKGRMLRMSGAFGPLQGAAVTGVLTLELAPVDAFTTRVTMTYAVGGYMPGGLGKVAPMVDQVIGGQLDRLAAAAEAPPPPPNPRR